MTAAEWWWLVAAILALAGGVAVLLAGLLPPIVDRLLRTAGALAVGAVAVGLLVLP